MSDGHYFFADKRKIKTTPEIYDDAFITVKPMVVYYSSRRLADSVVTEIHYEEAPLAGWDSPGNDCKQGSQMIFHDPPNHRVEMLHIKELILLFDMNQNFNVFRKF